MLMQCIAAALVALILMANNSMFIDAACSDMAGYNRCISKYARQVSDCGSLVKSTPTFAYYVRSRESVGGM